MANTKEVSSPYDGKILGSVPIMGWAEVEAALDLAHRTYNDRSKLLPKTKRVEILEKTMQIMQSQVEELTQLAASEGGKPYMDSKVEVLRAINGVKLAAEHIGAMAGREIPMGHTASSSNRLAFTSHEPRGVVLSISAFNHPLNLAVHQVIPAVAVGCPVLIKPAMSTPISANRLVEILREAGLPKEYAQVITCDRDAAGKVAASNKIAYLSFIGSAEVGWQLNSKVAPGVRVALEHGGVAPVIVEADADLDAMVPALTKGGFYHAGQVCVSVQRVFAHESIAEKLAEKMAEAASKLVVGDQLDPKTEVGPLISHGETQRVAQWVEEAVQGGAKALCGAKQISDSLYAPTILFNPKEDAKVSTHEVFGPVVCVYSYKNIDEAIERANALDVSFQAAVWTKNIDTAWKAIKKLNGTAVMVNDHTAFRVDWMPFGGVKSSGLGLGGIHNSMEEMSIEKLMVFKSSEL